MADAWRELQQAIRALRKQGEIRDRLIEAYRRLVKIRSKDLPAEVRHDHEWLLGPVATWPRGSLSAEIRDFVNRMTPAQLSEAVHRIVALHDALQTYQPAIPPTRQKQAACREQRDRNGHAEQGQETGTDGSQNKLF